MSDEIRLETVRKVSLQPGDILHIQVGGPVEVNGETITWIPTTEDLVDVGEQWAAAIPLQVGLLITNHLITPTIANIKSRMTTWPPRLVDAS